MIHSPSFTRIPLGRDDDDLLVYGWTVACSCGGFEAETGPGGLKREVRTAFGVHAVSDAEVVTSEPVRCRRCRNETRVPLGTKRLCPACWLANRAPHPAHIDPTSPVYRATARAVHIRMALEEARHGLTAALLNPDESALARRVADVADMLNALLDAPPADLPAIPAQRQPSEIRLPA